MIYFRCDELVCTSYPGGRRAVIPSVVDYLRQLNPPRTKKSGRRLFVQRLARTRSLRNESELLPLLIEHGFEVIDPGAIPDAETAFHESDYIVGPHGAALANLVFCRPGTKVLELVPTDHAYPYFFTLSVGAGLHYDCLMGPSDHETIRPLVSRWTSKSDFTIDPVEFARPLNRLMA
jgi:capsular polysaccharide biosynthesis protein